MSDKELPESVKQLCEDLKNDPRFSGVTAEEARNRMEDAFKGELEYYRKPSEPLTKEQIEFIDKAKRLRDAKA